MNDDDLYNELFAKIADQKKSIDILLIIVGLQTIMLLVACSIIWQLIS